MLKIAAALVGAIAVSCLAVNVCGDAAAVQQRVLRSLDDLPCDEAVDVLHKVLLWHTMQCCVSCDADEQHVFVEEQVACAVEQARPLAVGNMDDFLVAIHAALSRPLTVADVRNGDSDVKESVAAAVQVVPCS